jgi:hypothetical protein
LNKREMAIELLDRNVPPGRRITSNGDHDLFKRLTNTSHEDLQANWRKTPPGIMSACNGFVAWYARSMGIQGIDNYFLLEASLRSIGKGHAWVPSDGDSKPAYGDILHHTQGGSGLHVDVCIGFTPDGRLVRAAAGQILFRKPRNPDVEFDTLTRVTGTSAFNCRNLIGWLDIELFFQSIPGTGFRKKWATGWWDVKDGNQYFYYFDAGSRVQYVKKRPGSMFVPHPMPLNTGKYAYQPNGNIVIEWNPLDGGATIETFTPKPDHRAMSGTSRYGPLTGVKM